MKKIWGLILVLAGAAALVLYLNLNKSALPTGASATQSASARQPDNSSASVNPSGTAESASAPGGHSTSPPQPPANLAAQAGAVQPMAATVPPLDIPPQIVLQNVRHAITQYGAMFNGNPIGTNPEITAALAGNNPKQINFIKPEAGMRINEGGELVDAWGTPLFFHQLSGTDTEVRSAGPDRKMWTPDDLVTR
ncbi:MAG: hypothetical protein WAO02_03560 [Verrucomicrobiia bacterium]